MIATVTGQRRTPPLAVFTDFDGTLVELAETPDAIAVPEDLPGQLERAFREFDCAFAVLTGRQISEIDRYLAPLQLPVAGAHGVQRRRADGVVEPIDAGSIAAARAIAEAIAPLVEANPALLVETKPGAVALHYRQAPELEDTARIAMEDAVHEIAGFTLVPGKMVIEARPSASGKGQALRAFMQEAPFAGRLPIAIGDDTTDEDAFIAAQELGGTGIKLGKGDTAARLRIADIASVHKLLAGLIEIVAGDREAQITH